MDAPLDPEPLIAAERAAHGARLAAHAKEAERSRGVAWSGLGPEPISPLAPESILALAADKQRRLQDWRGSLCGRLLDAVAEGQRAAVAAHAAGEAARAALSRGAEAELARCILAADEMAAQAQAAARAARRALNIARSGPRA